MKIYHQLTLVTPPPPRLSSIQRRAICTHAALEGMAVTSNGGISSTEVAKMTGMTPAVLTFSGM